MTSQECKFEIVALFVRDVITRAQGVDDGIPSSSKVLPLDVHRLGKEIGGIGLGRLGAGFEEHFIFGHGERNGVEKVLVHADVSRVTAARSLSQLRLERHVAVAVVRAVAVAVVARNHHHLGPCLVGELFAKEIRYLLEVS